MRVRDVGPLTCLRTLAKGLQQQQKLRHERCAGHTDAVRALSCEAEAVANGRLFSESYDGTVRMWDVDSLTCLRTLSHSQHKLKDCLSAGHTDAVRALSVANGRLFSGSYDGTVRVWDVDSLTCLRTLAGHTGPVRTLVHSGGNMFSGSYDKTVRAEPLPLDCATSACSCVCSLVLRVP